MLWEMGLKRWVELSGSPSLISHIVLEVCLSYSSHQTMSTLRAVCPVHLLLPHCGTWDASNRCRMNKRRMSIVLQESVAGKQGWVSGELEEVGAVSGRAAHDPHYAQITLVACEGEMRETRVWKWKTV